MNSFDSVIVDTMSFFSYPKTNFISGVIEVSVHFLHAGTILKYSFLNQSISATKERQITEACLDKKSVVQFTPITLIYVTVIYVIRFEKMVGLTSYVAEI